MKNKILYGLWGCLYVLCVGLGTVDDPQGFGKVLLILTSLIFFLPPAVLMYDAIQDENQKTKGILRGISLVSLCATVIILVFNFLSASADTSVGDRLHEVLNLVSAPMLCSQYWIISLFLWACLLWSSFSKKKVS